MKLNHSTLRVFGLIVIVIIYFSFPNQRPDFTKFNCHDSESYIALSHNLVHGLGYTRSMVEGEYIPHTTWPPGMAVLLIPSMIFSQGSINWLFVKGSIILVGITGVIFTWTYVNKITKNKNIADASSVFIALNPYFWHLSRTVLTAVPVITWIIGSLLLIHIIWSKNSVNILQVFAGGVLIGSGMLLKGVVLGLAIAPVGYIIGTKRFNFHSKRLFFVFIVYFISFCLPFFVWNIRNDSIDKSKLGFDGINQVRILLVEAPNDPNSNLRNFGDLLHDVKNNFLWYVIYHFPKHLIPGMWASNIDSWYGGNYIALLIAVIFMAISIPRRKESLPLFITILPMIAITIILSEGGSERYWIPILLLTSILIFIQFSENFVKIISGSKKVTKVAIKILFFAILSFNLIFYITDFEKYPYKKDDAWRQLAQLFAHPANRCTEKNNPNIRVFTPNSHAFTLITGCPAPFTNEGLNLVPLYTHAVLRSDKMPALPLGTKIISQVYPWQLVKLSKPMPARSIVNNLSGINDLINLPAGFLDKSTEP